MTLFLSSDEKTLDGSNTRTKFKNRILPDFFQNESLNLELQEVFFDSKFPTLANFEHPHIITTVIGNQHELHDFPENFQNNSLFKYLCKNYRNKEFSPLLVEKESSLDYDLSKIDFEVFYEIHPRLNFAFSVAFIKDISIHSQRDVVNFLNSYMFPFHKKKPLKILSNGYIGIETNLNLYMSKNLFQLLGFINFESEISSKHLHLPVKEKYSKNFIEDTYSSTIHQDMLARMEEESPMYSIYRALIKQKPKGRINVEFAIGNSLRSFEIEYAMDLFHQRGKAFNYDEELNLINRLILSKYLSSIQDYVLSLKLSSSEEDKIDLNNFVNFLSKDRKNLIGLENWGGLFTLKRTKRNHVIIDMFHKEKNKEPYKNFHSSIKSLPGAPLVKEASQILYQLSRLKNVSFNPTLSLLLGASESSLPVTIQMEGEEDKFLPYPLDYYKSVRHELGKSTTGKDFLPLQLIQFEEEFRSFSSPIKLIKTEEEDMFMIDKRSKILFADETIKLKVNSPQLIFVMANFVQHSLVGSNQKKILNFFPLPKDSNTIVHHRFKKPITLKMIPGSVFHITLVDENFNQVKADVGTPTLLRLRKSVGKNMFPVTLISSDKTNLRLFPENKSNSFKNKLSFPLLRNHEHRWGVSLRSLAYPKVMNIFSKYCFFTVKKFGEEESLMISLDNSYVTSGSKLIYLLNQKVRDTLSSFSDAVLPKFALKDGFVSIETNDFECHLNGDMLKILGLTHSYQDNGIIYHSQSSLSGVLEMNLFPLQPQEMIIISNIVEEAFYAQQRPKILKIVPISTNQTDFSAYNYIQFEDDDILPVKLDRIDEIEISIMTRKGDLIDFVDLHDVKCQLEFKWLP